MVLAKLANTLKPAKAKDAVKEGVTKAKTQAQHAAENVKPVVANGLYKLENSAEKVATKAEYAAEQVATKAQHAVTVAADAVLSTEQKAKMEKKTTEAVEKGKAALDVVNTIAYQTKTAGMKFVDERKQRFRSKLETLLKRKIDAFISREIERLPGMLKDELDDPEMPKCAERQIHSTIDDMWPDIRMEIMYSVRLKMDEGGLSENWDDDAYDPGTCGGCCGFKSFIRYRTDPADKSIWGRLRDPWWVLLWLLRNNPIPALAPVNYFLIFATMDRADEYQLVSFILNIKGSTFFTRGIGLAVMGLLLYYECVTMSGSKDEHFCDTRGPGQARFGWLLWVQVAGLVLEVLLVWAAFLMLPYASQKGRRKLNVLEHQDSFKKNKVKSRLQPLLFWDCSVCVILMSLFVLVYLWEQEQESKDALWRSRSTFFLLQVLYGLLSFPFLAFKLPGLKQILTHAPETRYEKDGRIVPGMDAKHYKERRQKWLAQKASDEKDLLEEHETWDLFGETSGVVGGTSTPPESPRLSPRSPGAQHQPGHSSTPRSPHLPASSDVHCPKVVHFVPTETE